MTKITLYFNKEGDFGHNHLKDVIYPYYHACHSKLSNINSVRYQLILIFQYYYR